jgi:hypothetical protein
MFPRSLLALFARLAELIRRVFRGNRQPRLVIFFIPVPDAIPLPHGTTYSFMLGENERLAGLRVQPPGRDRTCDLGIKSPAFQQKTEFEKTPFRAFG